MFGSTCWRVEWSSLMYSPHIRHNSILVADVESNLRHITQLRVIVFTTVALWLFNVEVRTMATDASNPLSFSHTSPVHSTSNST